MKISISEIEKKIFFQIKVESRSKKRLSLSTSSVPKKNFCFWSKNTSWERIKIVKVLGTGFHSLNREI